MTNYHPYGVSLSSGQKEKLAKAYQNNSAITIRLTNNELHGNDKLMLTTTQLKRIQKAINNGNGADIKISKSQIRKVVQKGGSLFTALASIGARLLPYAAKAVPALATGAVSGLASMGVNKLFGSKKQSGGFLIPNSKIDQLIQHKDLLTTAQKKRIVEAIQTGGELVIKPTPKQRGGLLGALLASIGIPLALKLLTGKGLQVDRSRPRRSVPVYVPPTKSKKDGGLIVPWKQPPFFGTWDQFKNPIGLGLKKKKAKGKGLLLGKNSPFNNIPLLGAIL